MSSFYISGKFNGNEGIVQRLIETVVENGHSVAVDWTRLNLKKPYHNNAIYNRPSADAMLKAAIECDVFVLVVDNELWGGNRECGAAQAANMLGHPKEIWLLSQEDSRQSAFDCLEGVRVFHNIESVEQAMSSLSTDE